MFQNIVSLGLNCLTASAMSKYGLRSCSGPFDWCTSASFMDVISFIKNDFDDYLNYENLKVLDLEKPRTFEDVVHRINYNHDVTTSLENDYKAIYAKYMRRVNYFREMTKLPTCFIRVCWHPEELSTYVENENDIKAAIEKSNYQNELIVVVPRYIYEQNPVHCNFKLFIVDVEISGFTLVDRDGARDFFDTNKELIEYLTSNYPEDKRKDNLIWDLQAELQAAKRGHNEDAVIKELEKTIIRYNDEVIALQSRINRWNLIENKDFSSIEYPAKCAIYGCGAIGKIFSQRISMYTDIVEFLDRYPRQNEYNNIPVNRPEDSEFEYNENTPIIIVPSYDFEKITESIQETLKGNNITTIRFESFFANARTIELNF